MSLPGRNTNRGHACVSDLPDNAIREHVAHICQTKGFLRSERLKRFLSYTVERLLANDTDTLKEYAIALEVFDRSSAYNPKIDAVVRVEARRLRSRLEQYYATDGLHESIRIHFPNGSYVPVVTRFKEQSADAESPHLSRRNIRGRWWLIAGCLAVAATAIFGVRAILHRNAPAEIIRLIKDSTAAFDPDLSRDGKLLAYASDQSGNVDVWLRPLKSGEARRLTSNVAADTSPNFSPDSKQVVFRSERDGGGVYLMPVAAGLERLVAPLGRSPKFSPDGKSIAYWTGTEHHFEGKVFIVGLADGKTVRLGTDLADAKWPVWSPDGSALLVYGSRQPPQASGIISGPTDLFSVPLNGGPARETGWTAALRRASIWSKGPVSWHSSTLQFSATTMPPSDFSELSQGVANLWQIGLSQRRGRVEGEPRRVTFGAALERDSVLLASGGAVYSSRHYTLAAFEVATTHNGHLAARFEPSFSSPGSYVMPRISRDGSTLVALSDRSGAVDIWLKDLRTGEERAVTASNVPERAPVISSNGAWVYFGIREGPLYPMYKISARGGVPQKVCADCGGTSDISPDGNYVLYHSGEPWSAYCLNLVTGARILIASHKNRIYSSRFSPDGKWIAFETDIGDDEAPRQILVAPFSPDHSTPDSKWIPITAGNQRDFTPAWSEDGATVYFLSDRDGNRCIWAMRVDSRTKRPLGDAIPVLHLHRMNANVLSTPGAGVFGLSAGGGRLIFGAAQLSSTIYRIESSN